MSVTTDELRDPRQSGMHVVDPDERTAILEAARSLGFAVAELDLRDADKQRVLERFAHALQFPSWFGHNWDALSDSLRDLSWLAAPGYVIVIDHGEDWRASAPDQLKVLLEILESAVAFHATAATPFWVLLTV